MAMQNGDQIVFKGVEGSFKVALLLALCVGIGLACIAMDGSAVAEAPPLTRSQKADLHVRTADEEGAAAFAARIESIDEVFDRANRGASRFAEDALSWSGKWALVKDYVGISNGIDHMIFLNTSFKENVLVGSTLQTALENAVKGYLSDLDAIENRLVVQLRADLDDKDLGGDEKPAFIQGDEAFKREYERIAGEVSQTMMKDAQVEVGRQAVSLVGFDIAMHVVERIGQTVAAELGVEAAILGAGASSGVVTLGVGLVVGIVVDQLVSWVLKQNGYDPEKVIADKVREALRNLKDLLLNGGKGKPGLKGELEKLRQNRSKIQHAVADKLVKEGESQ
ncbi:hypothetical protein BH10PLA2_BH10PLA2_20470 [soil metagenome]